LDSTDSPALSISVGDSHEAILTPVEADVVLGEVVWSTIFGSSIADSEKEFIGGSTASFSDDSSVIEFECILSSVNHDNDWLFSNGSHQILLRFVHDMVHLNNSGWTSGCLFDAALLLVDEWDISISVQGVSLSVVEAVVGVPTVTVVPVSSAILSTVNALLRSESDEVSSLGKVRSFNGS
jgi:hypothetical protein